MLQLYHIYCYVMLDKISDIMCIEKYIAVKNNQMAKYRKRWNGFIKHQAA